MSNGGMSGLFSSTAFQSVHADDVSSIVAEKTNSPKAIISRVFVGYQFVLAQYLSASAMASLRGEPLFALSLVEPEDEEPHKILKQV